MKRTQRKIYLAEVGEVHVRRKKRMKSIRLRVDHDGTVVLSLPRWVMLRQALAFLDNKRDWVLSEKSKKRSVLQHGDSFANGIRLHVLKVENKRPSSSFKERCLSVRVPAEYDLVRTQEFIKRKVSGVIKSEAEQILLPCLRTLADKHQIEYKSASVVILKSRWGSCDHEKNIKLNAYLVQLPEHLINYVLAHELAHTKNMDHSQDFWRTVRTVFPDEKTAKKELKQYNPQIRTLAS
jgi:predicted metal-dependent hydrolase